MVDYPFIKHVFRYIDEHNTDGTYTYGYQVNRKKNIKNSNFFQNLSNFFPLISQRFKGYNCGKRG